MTSLISVASTSDARSPVLSVIDGLHQGVSLSLDRPLYSLGSGLHCDLVLSDIGIAEEHLRLQFSDQELAIEAWGGDVLVIGAGTKSVLVARNSGFRTSFPVEIHVGGAQLMLTKAQNPKGFSITDRRMHSPGVTAWLVGAALIALSLGGTAFALKNNLDQDLSAVDLVPEPMSSPMPSDLTLAQAQQWFEQQLQIEGFRLVTVTEVGNQLVAKGFIEQAMKSRWTALQHAFDQQFGLRWGLRSNVIVRAEITPPRVRFQAVWFGNDPYIVNDNGKRLYPGAPLPDNWILERIDPHEVVLSRGEERFKLTL